MNFTYVCELICKNGERRIVGPFKHTMGSTTGNAAAYGEEFKNKVNSEVVDYKVKMLEAPQTN